MKVGTNRGDETSVAAKPERAKRSRRGQQAGSVSVMEQSVGAQGVRAAMDKSGMSRVEMMRLLTESERRVALMLAEAREEAAKRLLKLIQDGEDEASRRACFEVLKLPRLMPSTSVAATSLSQDQRGASEDDADEWNAARSVTPGQVEAAREKLEREAADGGE